MKNCVRFFALSVILSLLCSLFSVSATGDITAGSEGTAEMEVFVSEFLTKRARNEWLYENNDLTPYLFVQNSAANTAGHSQYSVPIQTFLDTIDFYRLHRSFVGKIRTDFEVTHNFGSVDIVGDTARVQVYECVSYFITNGNGMPTSLGDEYIVTLTRVGDGWRISDIDIRYDPFYSENKHTNFNKQAALNQARGFILGDGEEMSLSVDGEAILRADQQRMANRATRSATTLISYNAGYAAAYANIYTNNTSGSSYYNSAFYDYSQYGDCANFVSQCIWAGFGGDNSRANTTAFPKDVIGNSLFHWHSEKSPESHSDMWTGAPRIGVYAEYMSTAPQTENGWYGSVYTPSNGNSLPSGVNFTGCAFLVYVQGAGNDQHAIFITSATGNNPDDIYYCAHTGNAMNACLADSVYVSFPIKIVKPVAYRRYNASCTGHTYTAQTSGNGYDSTCNVCGESRMLFTLAWNYGTTNTAKVINAVERNYQSCYKLVLEVLDSNGQPFAGGTFNAMNSSSVGGNYSFASAGLYTVRLKAWDSYASYQSSPNTPTNTYTYAIRIR